MDDATLVVCANAAERAEYTEWLRAEGYRVAEAASAAEAIAQHRRGSFPLTVAELASPSVDGLKLIQTVRSLNPQAELLMLSAGDSVDSAVAAMKAGAVDLLLKPVNRD